MARYDFAFTFTNADVQVTSRGHFSLEKVDPLAAAMRVHEIIAKERGKYPSAKPMTLAGLQVARYRYSGITPVFRASCSSCSQEDELISYIDSVGHAMCDECVGGYSEDEEPPEDEHANAG